MTLLDDDRPQRALRGERRRLRSARMRRPPTIRELFRRGHYREVLARTIDRIVDPAGGDFTDDEAAEVVGALAFVGRIDEAVACMRARRRAAKESREWQVEAWFHVAVALSRLGQVDRSRAALLDAAKVAAKVRTPPARFFVKQGIAYHRFMTGRLHDAAHVALGALESAFDARDPYARLLATDLRGHALVQIGEVAAGLLLLEQAQALAASLGLDKQVGVLASSLAIHRSRSGAVAAGEAIAALEALARAKETEDHYSQALVLLELVQAYAFVGRGEEARALLEALHRPTTAATDVRMRIRLLAATAYVTFLSHGPGSARPYLAEACDLLAATSDAALETDLLALELLACGPRPREVVEGRLRILAARDRILRAARYLEPTVTRTMACAEPVDRLETSLALVATNLDAIAATGALGLAGRGSGLAPRSIARLDDTTLLVWDHGTATLHRGVAAGTMKLLSALAAGTTSKEDLLARVWGLPSYRPERHDPTIHVAISRVRTLLGPRAHLVEAHDGGYRLAPEVAWIDRTRAASEVDRRDGLEAADPARPTDAIDPILVALREGPSSTSELAAKLGVSEMTAFRRIKVLLDGGLVAREGRGRATRVRLIEFQRMEAKT
jgi:DNA-binding winged helix-turn-helix (wHTH) protein